MKSLIKLFVLTIVLGLISMPVRAQAIQSVAWSHNNVTLAEVNTYQFNLKINSGTNNIITPTCVTSGVNVNCTFPVPSPTIIKTGDVVTLTASVNGQSTNATITVGQGPKPISVIVITIAVQ